MPTWSTNSSAGSRLCVNQSTRTPTKWPPEGAGFNQLGQGERVPAGVQAIWTINLVESFGKFCHVLKSYIGPKPAQKRIHHLHACLCGSLSAAQTAVIEQRFRRRACCTCSVLSSNWPSKRARFLTYGMIIRAHPAITDKPLGEERWLSVMEQIPKLVYFSFCSAIHLLVRLSRTSRGSVPPLSISSWKLRMSNFAPNSRWARSRSSRNLSCPSL